MLLTALLAACSLDVNDLPENHLPNVGSIVMDPEVLAPLDSISLSISAEDPDGDDVFYLWSAGGIGSWVDDSQQDSLVVWIAPTSFADIDTVHFLVNVWDIEQGDGIQRTLDVVVETRTGDLRVRIFDLEGNPAPMRLVLPVVEDTTETAQSEQLLTDILWGVHQIYPLDSESYYGVYDTGYESHTQALVASYSESLYVVADVENVLELTVAPKSLLVVPGNPADTLLLEIQEGIDYCAEQGIDSLLLRTRDYTLPGQSLPGYEGSEEDPRAALLITEADLTLAAFPGDGPIRLDVGANGCDFGLYLEGRSPTTQVAGLAIQNAGASGAYLYHSGGSFDTVLFESCGSTGLFLLGGAADTLRIHRAELRSNEHGLSLSGGHVLADSVTIDRSFWYGIWLRDGATAALSQLTLRRSEHAGLFTAEAGVVAMERCLIAGNGRGVFNQSGPSPELSCNLFWDNVYGDYNALVDPGADDLQADPLFCSPDAADGRVETGSPALDGACAPIGAWGDCLSPGSPFEEGSP